MFKSSVYGIHKKVNHDMKHNHFGLLSIKLLMLKVPIEQNFGLLFYRSHMKDHLIPKRMQFTASCYLFSFQSYRIKV